MADWYDEWADRHVRAFCLNDSDDSASTLALWHETIQACGYTAAELHEASDWLLRNPKALEASLKFQGRMVCHLAALHARIREARAVSHNKQRDNLFDRGTCTRCGGSGTVSVPHLRGIKDGEWVPQAIARGAASYYTMAVRCTCALGNWFEEKMTDAKGQKAMSLERYATINPRWEIQLEKRKQQQLKLAEIDTRFDKSTAKRLLDEAMDRLEKEFGLEHRHDQENRP